MTDQFKQLLADNAIQLPTESKPTTKLFGGKIRLEDFFYGDKPSKESLQKMVEVDQPVPIRHKSTDEYLSMLVTQDADMLTLKDNVRKLCAIPDTVLIYGETGTGKELVARALHGTRTGKFLAINCGGFPEYLVDSILFGHKRGAFTGADKEHQGVFASCQNGTVFLDEIAELPLHMQAKLLRVLQEKEITPVGSNTTVRVVCRVVCATNKDLCEMVKEKRFREDLYWRLTTFILRTKPLRERPEDIALYLKHVHCEIEVNDKILLGNYRQLQQLVRRHQLNII